MQKFPGSGMPPVDERIVAPESRAEILEGRLIFAPPAEEKHAVPHADLAYVLRAHVKPEFKVAVSLPDRPQAEGLGASKRAAEQAAAEAMLTSVGVKLDKVS